MSPYEQAKAVYDNEPSVRPFAEDFALHLEFGFVFCTPRFFVMGRPVNKDAPHGLILDPSYVFPRHECNCWHVYLMSGGGGAPAQQIAQAPVPLPAAPVTQSDPSVVQAEHDLAQQNLLKKSVKKTIVAGDTGGWKPPAAPRMGP